MAAKAWFYILQSSKGKRKNKNNSLQSQIAIYGRWMIILNLEVQESVLFPPSTSKIYVVNR